MEQLLSSEECRLIAVRTLQLKEDDENLVLISWNLVAGPKDLMGYMGEYYKLHLKVEHSEPKVSESLQYFVKSLPHNNAPQRAECERKGVFRKEATVYREILPNVQRYASRKLFPQCYYSRDDVMVLEDLTQHYRHLKPTESYSLEHYKVVLEHLAALHAASIAWEQQENLNIGERYDNVLIELFLSMENTWFITGLKGIVFLAGRHPKYQTESAQKFIREKLYHLLTKSEELVRPSSTIRNVFCHRDTWDRNILFGFESPTSSLPNSCCIVDFQLAKYCSPLLDVVFLLYILPSSSQRREIYELCLDHYYQSLQAEFQRLGLSSSLISRDNFTEECERSRLVALIKWALSVPQTKVSAEITNRMRAEDPEKFDHYLNIDRSEFYLRVMELQPGFEETIMEPIEELVDYLIKHDLKLQTMSEQQQLISLDESLKILRAQDGRGSIDNVQLEQLNDVMGFLGEYYVLRIVTEPELPHGSKIYQSFVKTLPQNNVEYRAECERKGVLKKECDIYREILPNLQKFIDCKIFADCYLHRDDLLVLEDLSLNYRQVKETFTISHYRLILRRLATLHAASIAWERAEQFSLGERYKDQLFELLLSNQNEWYITGAKAIIYLASKHAQFQDCSSQCFIKNKLFKILLQAEKLAQPSKKLRNVFCHRDPSLGNIFLSSSDDCVFVDFGLSTYSPPAIDVHFLLYINSSMKECRHMYKELLNCYFNELQDRFKALHIPAREISREDFLWDCKRGHLAGLIMAAICLPIFKIPKDVNRNLRLKYSSKFDYWMNVERSELLDLAMANSPVYKEEVMSIIAELVQFLKAGTYEELF